MQASSIHHLLHTVVSMVGTSAPKCAQVSPEPLVYPHQRLPGLDKSSYLVVKCKRGFENLTTVETSFKLIFQFLTSIFTQLLYSPCFDCT